MRMTGEAEELWGKIVSMSRRDECREARAPIYTDFMRSTAENKAIYRDAYCAAGAADLLDSFCPESVSLRNSLARWLAANQLELPGAKVVRVPAFIEPRIGISAAGHVQILPTDKFPFKPNPGMQVGFFNDLAHRWIGYASGMRGGKSVAAARKLILLHILNAFDASGRAICVRGMMVALSYSLAKSTNIPQIATALDDFNLSCRVHLDPTNMRIVIRELASADAESEILVRSAEVPKAIAGFDVGHIWGDEVGRWYRNRENPDQDAFFQSNGRLSDKRAGHIHFLATSTHEGEDTTFNHIFSDGSPERKIYSGTTLENAHNLEPNYIDAQKSILSKELYDQYILGIAMPGGSTPIYYAFGPDNIIESFPLNQSLPLCLAMDFNVTPGSYAILFQFDQARQMMFVLREFFALSGGARQVGELSAREIISMTGSLPHINPTNWKFHGVLNLFGDASGGNRSLADARLTSWSEVVESLRCALIPCTAKHVPESNPRVADRCAAVNCALRAMDGTIRLKIVKDAAPGLLEDFKRMRWLDGAEDKSDSQRSHPSSAIGYAVSQLLPIR